MLEQSPFLCVGRTPLTRNNLVELYRAMGRHAEAEPLYKEALDILRTALGEQHPSFATTLNNLALLYQAMGRHAEAAQLENQVPS